MRFERNGSDISFKLIDPDGNVIGYVWKALNGYWQAATGEGTGRIVVCVPSSGYRDGRGYVWPNEAGSAIIHVVTEGRGV